MAAHGKKPPGVRRSGKSRVVWDRGSVISLVATSVFVITGLGLFVWMGKPPSPSPASDVAPVGGEIRLPLRSGGHEKVQFFRCVSASGERTRFLVAEAPSNHYHVALDASENGTGRFRVVEGRLACTGCRLRFDPSKVGELTGGCYPIPVPHRVEDGHVVIRQIDLENASRRVGRNS